MTPKSEFTFERMLNAPLDLVWKVHTEAEHLVKWWGPAGMKFSYKKMEFKPGGIFHFSMEGSDGSKMWAKFIYREISPKTKLVFVVNFTDENGVSMKHPMASDWPLDIQNTITFEAIGNQTKVILKGQPLNATESEEQVYYSSFDSMNGGYGGSYDVLIDYLKTF
jgi:uncharacterized protein YndB with AHSA1/START domain